MSLTWMLAIAAVCAGLALAAAASVWWRDRPRYVEMEMSEFAELIAAFMGPDPEPEPENAGGGDAAEHADGR